MEVCTCPNPVESGEYISDNGVDVPICGTCNKAIITRGIRKDTIKYNTNRDFYEEPER